MKAIKRKTLLIVVVVLVAGLYIGDHLFLKQQRDLASFTGAVKATATKTYYDLTEIPDSEFNLAFKTALISGLVVEKTANTLGLSWGQFLVKNASDGKVYACEKYPFLEVELRAEGVANSGEIPALILRGPCLTSDDGKKILPFPIPLENLMERLRVTPEIKAAVGTRGDQFTISARDLYPPGARYWNVVNLKLYNETEALSVDGYEIISLLDQALTLDFAVSQ